MVLSNSSGYPFGLVYEREEIGAVIYCFVLFSVLLLSASFLSFLGLNLPFFVKWAWYWKCKSCCKIQKTWFWQEEHDSGMDRIEFKLHLIGLRYESLSLDDQDRYSAVDKECYKLFLLLLDSYYRLYACRI